jgi:tetratricopeptide (TPR) repeat protein
MPSLLDGGRARSDEPRNCAARRIVAVERKASHDMSNEATSLCRMANDLHRQGRHSEALAAYDRAIELNPCYPAALNNRGVVLLAVGQAAKALESFERAVSLQPDFAEALYNRANALRGLKRIPEALADYDRAIAVRPNYAMAFNNRGATLQELERPLEALESYDRALALSPSYADAWENKAILQSEFGEVEGARRALETLIRAEPRRARAHFQLVRMKRMTREDPQLPVLEALARERNAMGEKEAVDISFALGKAYDDIGEYELAFAHFAEGNALKRAGIVYNEVGTLAHLRRIASAFTPDAVDALRGLGDATAAPIFIFGMPRSGSTLIEQILSCHPDISARGEVDAFERAAADVANANGRSLSLPEMFSLLPAEQLSAIGRRYLEKMRVEGEGAKRTTDKKPSNFLYAGLIHLALPGARLIHTRRNAIDTCWSCFSQRFADVGMPSAYDLGELGRFYCAYDTLMEHWRRALPEGAILTVDYEDVVADLEGQTRRILAHCGLAWNDGCLEFHKSRRHVRTASAGQVNQPLYKSAVGHGRNYERFLAPLMNELAALSRPDLAGQALVAAE